MKNINRNTELTGLIKQLNYGNHSERQAALKQLAEFNDKRATKAIAKLLNDQSMLMVMLAVRDLAKIGDEIAIKALA